MLEKPLSETQSAEAEGMRPLGQDPQHVSPQRQSGRARAPGRSSPRHSGLQIDPYFVKNAKHPFDDIEWETRDATITGGDGVLVFEQKNVEFPKSWSQMATNVVVQKYFRGALNTPERETSLRQLIGRVVDTIVGWGRKQNYFADEESAQSFSNDLAYLLVTQRLAFNSPVWFNVGVEDPPQCSACFINSVDDRMESIMDLVKTEGMLFKYGSGTGTNFSSLRGSKELLNGGGAASGPVSFMRGYDAFAGVIKSGGKTRRAAKMVILNADHPDIVEFIDSKAHEERKAWALIDSGYDGSFNGEAYNSVFFQNANHSVRVTDAFMQAVSEDREWELKRVTDGKPSQTLRARDLMRAMAQATHQCGDPGMQWDTTINRWHTCHNTAPINASNPCSEYMFLDDSACNLASLNLRKFQDKDGAFDGEAFIRGVRISTLAQEIIVDNAKYPTEQIAKNSYKFRPLGLGYANLGALLMNRGLPYDSDAGRALAAAITALMHGESNRISALIAADRGPFEGYALNREPMARVMSQHQDALGEIDAAYVPYELMESVRRVWDETIELGERHGYRNAQTTVLAPTGTIAFMMDCDTTGVEPDIALVKYKKLVGGGLLKMVNNTVQEALSRLGYTDEDAREIIAFIDANDGIEGAPHLKDEHLPVFDCAFRSPSGERTIHYLGHIRMMGAVQPFLSGAISKTVNMPGDCSPEDIQDAYLQAWRMGLKALAIYRDGSKRTQPLNTEREATEKETTLEAVEETSAVRPLPRGEIKGPPQAVRHHLPDERRSLTHKFTIGGHEGYVTVGLYKDGRPGEIFIRMAKEGSTICGLVDSFATAVSLSLQHGVPLSLLVNKFAHTRFEPSGWSDNKKIGYAKSIMDYIFRWLSLKFPEGHYADQQSLPGFTPVNSEGAPHPQGADASRNPQPAYNTTAQIDGSERLPISTEGSANSEELSAGGGKTRAGSMSSGSLQSKIFYAGHNAPPCSECGSIEMVPNGSCYKCLNCGSTSGCS